MTLLLETGFIESNDHSFTGVLKNYRGNEDKNTYFFSCVLREQKDKKRERKRERIYALNKDSFLKNKFTVLNGSAEGFCPQSLNGCTTIGLIYLTL